MNGIKIYLSIGITFFLLSSLGAYMSGPAGKDSRGSIREAGFNDASAVSHRSSTAGINREGDFGIARVVVSIEKTEENVSRLRTLCLDILMDWQGKIYIVASAEDLRKLGEAKLVYRDETRNFPPSKPGSLFLQTTRNGAFHSYGELERDLFALEQAYPHLAKVYDVGDSHEMRNIYALKISDNVEIEEEGEARAIILGCHHAREWISVEVPYYIAEHLCANYAADPLIRSLVDRSEVWIVPLVNPDGLEYTIHFYRYWRKNTRNNGDGSYGVDPNRNYGFRWGYDDEGSSPDPFSYVYRGPGSFSEPETRAVRDLIDQKKFEVLISYHSYSQVILYPWGYTAVPSEIDALFEEMAGEMAGRMAAVNGRVYAYGAAGSSLYLTNGDTVDWAFGEKGIPAFTIELPPVDFLLGAFVNPEEDIRPIVNENIPAMLYVIDWAICNRQ